MTQSTTPSPFAALANLVRGARQAPEQPQSVARTEPTMAPMAAVEFSPPTAVAQADAGAASAAEAVPAEPAATAAVFTPAAAYEPLKSIAVIVGHSDRRFAQILTGVVGEIAQDKFTVDPAYGEISYLFTLAASGDIDVEQANFENLPMLAGDVAAFRANLIRGSSAAWDALYESAASQVAGGGDIGARMLAAERAKVGNAVAAHLAAQGLTAYAVPVIASVGVPQPESLRLDDPAYRATEADLVKEGRVRPESLQVDATREVVALATLEPLEPASPALPEQLRGHTGGFEIKAAGTVSILATSPEQALRVMMNLMVVVNRNTSLMQNVLTCEASNIQNVDMVPYEAYESLDDDDEWRERG